MSSTLMLLINISITLLLILSTINNINFVIGAPIELTSEENSREVGGRRSLTNNNNNNNNGGRLVKREVANFADYTFDDWVSNKIDDWWWNNVESSDTTTNAPAASIDETTNWYPNLPIAWGRRIGSNSNSN